MTPYQHSGANFNESVIWSMCALDVSAMRYRRSNAPWCAAEIQTDIQFRALDGTN
jgi:hypothetical protein